MPTGNPRPCTYPGCPALVPSGRCARHPYERLPDDRPASHKRGYDAAWRKVRADYLHDHPRCEYRAKCTGARATEVDHIVPLARGGTHDARNLRATCKPCHSRKTATLDTKRDNRGRFNAKPKTERDEAGVHRTLRF